MCDWRILHGQVIQQFIQFLNSSTDRFVLKGGTSLMLCYGLTRFSEDIDLDSEKEDIIPYVQTFAKSMGYTCRVAKNTATVKRCLVHYGGEKPLKIEVSYRQKNINWGTVTQINGIVVYNVQQLFLMKLYAYSNRDKIRDLFDVTFLGTHYTNVLFPACTEMARQALMYKDFEQFDYIVHTQHDDLIDVSVLQEQYLQLWDILGLL